MDKYIEREALIEWLKRIKLIDLSDGHGLCRVIMEDDFKKAIKKMPKGIIADVATVRHGRWIASHDEFCACSICKYPVYVGWNQTNYCPNCGARMDGKDGGRMTYEEAKALFEQDLKGGKCSDDCPECNARELAISAIEKQIPKRHSVKVYDRGSFEYICPSCDCSVQDYQRYCDECGQAIDWSDTE